ncbi:MAG: hypothetical protein AAF441_13560 [Pseudomonadota bacterium]
MHLAEALQQAGHIAAVAPLAAFLTAPNPDFEVYVFHRPSVAHSKLKTVLAALHQLGAVTIADLDRYIFPESGEENGSAYGNELQALKLFRKVTVATHALADALRNHQSGTDLMVLPDSLPASLLGLHEVRRPHLKERPRQSLAYVQAPGGHGLALRQIWDVVYKVLSEHEEATLTLFGTADVPEILTNHPNASVQPVLRTPYRMTTYSRFDCILDPALPGPQSKCVSRANYMEATLAGSRLISSPLPDLPPLRQPNLKVAPSPTEWYEHLTNVLEKPVHSDDMLTCVNRTIEVRASRRFVADFLKFLAGG